MADRESKGRRMTPRGRFASAGLAAIILLSISGVALASGRHFLSHESLRRPEEFRLKRGTAKYLSLRRFKVSRDKVARLKKSSFLNKRPYQFASPVISGGRLYVGVDAGRFYAFDLKGTKRLWEFGAEGAIHGAAAAAGEAVYFGDSESFVYALDAGSGGELWRAKLDAEVLATPLVAGERIFVADMSGRLYALDRGSGAEVWHTEAMDKGAGFSIRRSSSPVELDGRIVVGTAGGAVIAHSAADGSISWVRQIGDRLAELHDVDSRPLVAGGRLFASSADGVLAALDPATGAVLWTADAGGANDVIEHDGALYASGQGVLTSLDPATGGIRWQQELKVPEISTPVAGGHFVAVASTTDKFYLIDRDTGDVAYARFVGKGSLGDPAIEGDDIYLLSNNGRLFTFSVKELPPRKTRD